MRGRGAKWTLVSEHSVLFSLIGLNLVIFVFQLFLPDFVFAPLECTPADIRTAWNRLISGSFSAGDLKHWVTLITYAFLHADIEHVLFNMLYLWIFGYLSSELLGQQWVVPIYLITAIGAALCYVIFEGDSSIPMLGASGAVMGFEGAYLGLAVRYSLPHPHVWPLAEPVSPLRLAVFAIVGVMLDLSGAINPGGSNTAFAAHLGGFVTGIFLTSFITPMPSQAK